MVVGFLTIKGVIKMEFRQPEYFDSDSGTVPLKVKQQLNALYGKEVTQFMCNNNQYITVQVDNKPMIIFKDKIISITKNGTRAEIQCTNDVVYYCDTSYVDVVAKLFK
jgi:hypothetical protein